MDSLHPRSPSKLNFKECNSTQKLGFYSKSWIPFKKCFYWFNYFKLWLNWWFIIVLWWNIPGIHETPYLPSPVTWSTSLRLRAWCPTFLIISKLGGWSASWWRCWSYTPLLKLWAISTAWPFLRVFIIPCSSLLVVLIHFLEIISLDLLSMGY